MFFRTASSPAPDGDATDVDVMLILAADDRRIIGPGSKETRERMNGVRETGLSSGGGRTD